MTHDRAAPGLRPPAAAGVRGRRTGALGALLAVLLVATGALPATPATAQSTTQAAADRPLAVLVSELAPRAPLDPAERFTVSGTVVNGGAEAVSGLQLSVVVGRVVRSRGELARADELRRVSGATRAVPTPAATDLAPGASTTFTLDVPVGDLRLLRLGVYPVAVQARGRAGDARSRTLLGQAVTFVPWFPDGPPQRTRIAWLWPLVDRPRITPDNLLVDDGLDAELATGPGPSGRLGRLLGAARSARSVPVTYAVDPDLLVTVDGMTRPYGVRTGPDERVERPPSAAAAAWLAELRAAVREPATGLLALPYADPDVVALTRPGSELAGDVDQLGRLGARVAAELTGQTPMEQVVWPPAGRLSPAALDAALGEATAVVLDEIALAPRSASSGRTGSTAVSLSSPVSGALTGLVVEQGLSRLVTAGPEDPGWQGPRLAEQRFLAETAMIAAERPGESRTLLVAPDRRGDVVPEVATGALLDSTRLPWLCPVGLTDVAAGRATCPATPAAPLPSADPPGPGGEIAPPVPPAAPASPAPPSPLEDRGPLEPAEPTDVALSDDYLERVAEVDALAEQFTDDVLVPTTPAATATRARLLRARGRTESSAWRDAPRGGRVLLDLLADEVRRLRGLVTLSTSGRVALSSSTGTITVNVSNALDQPVTVGVGLNDPIEARLTSTSTGTREVPASLAVQVPIEVATRTSGQFVVRATLLDRTGRPFGEPAELVVRSTGYSRAALAVTGLGAAVLLVAAGVRIARRALRRTPGTA